VAENERTFLLERAHAVIRDRAGRIIAWNKGTTHLYGWSEQEVQGQHLHTLLKTVFPCPLEQIENALRSRGQWEGELLQTRKDGRTLVVASQWAQYGAGKSITVIETYDDITEVKRLQEALRALERRKDEFLATLAHELRNPLAPIRNALHLMRLTKNNAATVEQARGMMERQVKNLVRLIDDLLELSRLSRGTIAIKKEPVQAQEIITMAIEGSRPWIEGAGRQLAIRVPGDSLWLEADPLRLTQVLLNLSNNAAKYTEPEGEIGLSVERAANGEIVFRVRDAGAGIPPEMLPRIFDMFTQVDRSLDRVQGGLGIGLSLVRGLVELHGGSIEAHSAGLGRGSEFIVRLPELHLGLPESAVDATKPEPAGTPLRILVVDDNRDAADSLAELLHALGHDVREAYDGTSALAVAERERPDVILCDIGLPGLTGYEVAQRVRAQPELGNVILIALTGWGQPEDRRRTREAGFDAHLVKPVEQEALTGILHSIASPH
jgi:two-component system, chemotaxis family, CheB/CheR fusion protein